MILVFVLERAPGEAAKTTLIVENEAGHIGAMKEYVVGDHFGRSVIKNIFTVDELQLGMAEGWHGETVQWPRGGLG